MTQPLTLAAVTGNGRADQQGPRVSAAREQQMRRNSVLTIGAAAVIASALSLSGMAGGASASGPRPAPPPASRVVIVLFDQMLPQYADQFDMPNFRKVRDAGVNYNKAYLGYMASETVIAHNVIPSGLLPRNMGYTDEAYRDYSNVFGKNCSDLAVPKCTPQMHITGDLSLDDFAALQKKNGKPYPKLADYLHTARPDSQFITVGEKSYAVETATGASGDIAVRLSGRKTAVAGASGCGNLAIPTPPAGTPGVGTGGAWRGPQGKNVPGYLLERDTTDPNSTVCGRYFINSDSGNHYGTKDAFPSWLYASDGYRYWPGNDPAHLGGDTWVADAAIEMMQKQ